MDIRMRIFGVTVWELSFSVPPDAESTVERALDAAADLATVARSPLAGWLARRKG